MSKEKILGTTEAWETGELGEDAAHVRKASQVTVDKINEALGLQAISIRLPKDMIDTYKLLAQLHGVGYQPLMRDVICRWADGELRQMLIAATHDKTAKIKAPKDVKLEVEPMRKAA